MTLLDDALTVQKSLLQLFEFKITDLNKSGFLKNGRCYQKRCQKFRSETALIAPIIAFIIFGERERAQI